MNYVPDPVYNPEFRNRISARTKLAPGIALAKFLGGYGDPVTIDHIDDQGERLKLAKQYYLHAEAMRRMKDNEEFINYRLVVAEGLYKKGLNETLDVESINGLCEKGQAVIYELRNQKGEIDTDKTFDLALYWMQNLDFEKMILDYDIFDPSGDLYACIVLIMPKILAPWNISFKNNVETRFNTHVQSTNELIECLIEQRDTSPKLNV
jgi:hypothetical protein